ncbi:VanZ family protein [Anaerosporobacter faecicola]|uniref:VanZ family protein n=1 Tax=Anaerosporobacter faecicola TaxID=2718714 RepID=UPI001EE6027F|nr:VanZ family protein [Anaerosporobacter faecicola]
MKKNKPMKKYKPTKKHIRQYICIVGAILWMGVIFSFSARNGSTSTGDSNQVGILLGKMVVPNFENWSMEKQQNFAEKVDYPIRKTAHAMEYAVLGGFLAGAVWNRRKKGWNVVIPWGIGTLYAATDETHQLFVPGRSGQVSDVILDSAGVLIGVGLICIILNVIVNDKKCK